VGHGETGTQQLALSIWPGTFEAPYRGNAPTRLIAKR
jgi:hypothetical protein